MRRSFTEHLYAFCEAKGYQHSESMDPWSMSIENVIVVTKVKDGYEARDTVLHLRCWSKAAAWMLMCAWIEEVVKRAKEKAAEPEAER